MLYKNDKNLPSITNLTHKDLNQQMHLITNHALGLLIDLSVFISPVYTAQTNPGRTWVRPGLKLTHGQVVFTRQFSKLTRVEPGLVVFTRQKLTRVSLYRVNRALITTSSFFTLPAFVH